MPIILCVCVCVFRGVSRAPVAEGNLELKGALHPVFVWKGRNESKERGEGGERGVTQCQMAGCGVTGAGRAAGSGRGKLRGRECRRGLESAHLRTPGA